MSYRYFATAVVEIGSGIDMEVANHRILAGIRIRINAKAAGNLCRFCVGCIRCH